MDQLRIEVTQTERGWELMYSYIGGPFACGPEDESPVYSSRKAAERAAEVERAGIRQWNRPSYAAAVQD